MASRPPPHQCGTSLPLGSTCHARMSGSGSGGSGGDGEAGKESSARCRGFGPSRNACATSPASAAEQPAEPKPAERLLPNPPCASRHQPETKHAGANLRRGRSSLRSPWVIFFELLDGRGRLRDILR